MEIKLEAFNRREVLEYLLWRGGEIEPEIDALVDDCMAETLRVSRPRYTYRVLPVDRTAQTPLLAFAGEDGSSGRLADSLETAIGLTGGVVEVDVIGGELLTLSQNFACPEHGIGIEEMEPRMFWSALRVSTPRRTATSTVSSNLAEDSSLASSMASLGRKKIISKFNFAYYQHR